MRTFNSFGNANRSNLNDSGIRGRRSRAEGATIGRARLLQDQIQCRMVLLEPDRNYPGAGRYGTCRCQQRLELQSRIRQLRQHRLQIHAQDRLYVSAGSVLEFATMRSSETSGRHGLNRSPGRSMEARRPDRTSCRLALNMTSFGGSICIWELPYRSNCPHPYGKRKRTARLLKTEGTMRRLAG